MTQSTRCPACATRFKVVPDQLKIGQGWVRCGQCGEVFDARLSLKPLAVPPVTPQAEAPGEGRDEPALSIDLPPPPADQADQAEPGGERAVLAFDDLRIDPGAVPPEPAPEPFLDSEALPASTASAGFDTASDLSFVRRARRRAAWRRPWVRALLLLLALGLSLLLALQAAFHWRDPLATQYPVLRPLLAALCEQAQCRLGVPRRIESITIDGSSFTRLQGETYRLAVNLSNQSGAPVAMPAIELTLTDAQDQAVLRRVLLPADFGADTPERIAASGEWSLSASILVTGAANVQRISGYRVLAFYP